MESSNVSIMVRIRRTIVEEIHVSVDVTNEMIEEAPDGSSHLAPGKIFEEAVRMGQTQELAWRREGEALVEIHPLQTPPPGYPVPGAGEAT
jgi:hypothetical protein